MEFGFALKISSIFVLFLASLFGISLPLVCTGEWFFKSLPLLNSTAAGVMLGLALVSLFIYVLAELYDVFFK